MTDDRHDGFGTCPCGSSYDRRYVEVTMRSRGDPLVLTDIPQGVCPSCGSRVYKAEVLKAIESAYSDGR
ncbi:YgiT-type zinc finger protein [Geodermatophilus sp. URMC 63]